MVRQRGAQTLPCRCPKPVARGKGGLRATRRMFRRQEILGYLLLFDECKMQTGESLRLQRTSRYLAGNGPKAGGGMRRLEAAS